MTFDTRTSATAHAHFSFQQLCVLMWVVHPHRLQVHYLSSSVGEALRSHRLWKISTYSTYTHTHTHSCWVTRRHPHQEGETQPPQVLRTCSRPPQQDFCCLICFCRAQSDENCAAFRGNTIENLLCVFLSHFVSFVAKQSTILISQINTRASAQELWDCSEATQHAAEDNYSILLLPLCHLPVNIHCFYNHWHSCIFLLFWLYFILISCCKAQFSPVFFTLIPPLWDWQCECRRDKENDWEEKNSTHPPAPSALLHHWQLWQKRTQTHTDLIGRVCKIRCCVSTWCISYNKTR